MLNVYGNHRLVDEKGNEVFSALRIKAAANYQHGMEGFYLVKEGDDCWGAVGEIKGGVEKIVPSVYITSADAFEALKEKIHDRVAAQ